ncbi:MAG TPA: asparagine synthase (glutamine-hydrolyzing) [Deltaproteobacteria bacterium]|nr:asparagine synthase (glutamine-hydrolyzing) [Deltaproteobacteria bacterium]
MCGIAGFLSSGGARPAEEVLRGMGDALAHRGPDASGTFISPDGRVGLSHRRLSILDLSPAGAQPMFSSDGALVLSFNGEVYNFREIRAELEAKGHAFRGGSDTEVMLAAFREWGVDAAVRRFIGMFAFALWDAEAGKLYLVRDRLGIKPLYLARLPGMLLFASTLSALLAYPDFPRKVDRSALQYFLEFQYVPGPHAIYRDVEKVLPGHIVEIGQHGEITDRTYWDLFDHWGKAEGRTRTEGECEEELSALLDSSIRYRMISDVPLGAFLSGGIDSSLVVALMRKAASGPVKTFSIGFRESGYDESPHARAVAMHLGTDHQEKICTPREAQALVRRIPDAYDEPFADSSAIPTMLVSEFTRGHVTVSLSGDGGDELFCGYPRYAWVRQGNVVRGIPGFLRRPLCSLLSRVPIHKVQRGAESVLYDDPAEMYFHTVGIFERRRLGEIVPEVVDDAHLPYFRTFRDPRCGGIVERAMATDIKTYLVDDILTKVDRASMAYSLEARVPLLDHRIVEFAARLPMEHKVHGGGTKHLLRKILSRHVPRELIDRPKMGFGIPVNRWLRKELRPLLTEYLNEERVRREGFLRPEGVERVVREHLSGRRDHQYRLWALLVIAMWVERYRPTS